jgi:adenylyltransferase/sulfurtransferase
MSMLPDLTEPQIRRYARHIVLAEIGGVGQSRLIAARVLVVGAGGLGAPLLQYLAAAGVGTLGVIDHDTVDLSNLQRQVIHRTADIGVSKVESARRALSDINPEVRVEAHSERLTAANAERVIAAYDIVADGSDNFATRYLLNDVCYRLRRLSWRRRSCASTARSRPTRPGRRGPSLPALPVSRGAVGGRRAELRAGRRAGRAGRHPGRAAGHRGREGDPGRRPLAVGRLLTYDALDGSFDEMAIAKRPDCPTCGRRMSPKRPVDHRARGDSTRACTTRWRWRAPRSRSTSRPCCSSPWAACAR